MIMRLAIMAFVLMIGLGCGVIVSVVAEIMVVVMMRRCVGHAGRNFNCAMMVQRFMGQRVGHT